MLRLPFEEPINIRCVKEIGPARSAELQGKDKDFYVALHATNRLYDYLDSTPEDEGIITQRLMTVFSSVQIEALLFRYSGAGECIKKTRHDFPPLHVSPRGTKAFYLRTLARTKEMLILDQLEKNIREHGGVQEADRQLLQMLEKIPLPPEKKELLMRKGFLRRMRIDLALFRKIQRRCSIAHRLYVSSI